MITPDEGVALLQAALRSGMPQIAAFRLNLDQLPTRWRERPLFETIHQRPGAPQDGLNRDSRFLRDYRQFTGERKTRPTAGAFAVPRRRRTLGINSPNSVAVDQALSDMGLDSLASLELGNNLEESLNVAIPSTLVYDHPTLVSMADYFLTRLLDNNGPVDDASNSTSCRTSSPRSGDEGAQQQQDMTDSDNPPSALKDTNDSADVVQNIRELSEELDRWDEV